MVLFLLLQRRNRKHQHLLLSRKILLHRLEEILATHFVEAELLLAALLELNDKLSQDGLHLLFGSLDIRGRISCLHGGRLLGRSRLWLVLTLLYLVLLCLLLVLI